MRAPMIPGKKPEDNDQREAMLRRLGIAEEKPRTPSRWDVLARDMEPAAPVQTPPPVVEELPVEEPLPAHQPIPMTTEALRGPHMPEPAQPAPEPVALRPVAREPEPAPEPVVAPAPVEVVVRQPEPEPVAEAPVARAPEPEVAASSMNGASFMPGWGEESIPEDEDVEAFDEPEAPVEAAVEPVIHQPRWMDEPVAEAPRREELLPKMERPVGFTPSMAPIANDQDLDLAPEPEAPGPLMEAYVEPQPAAPIEFPAARQPVAPPPEPVVAEPVLRDPFTPAPPAPEPVVEAPVARRPEPVAEPEPAIRRRPEPDPEPVVEAEPVIRRPAPQPEPAPAAPPVDAALQQMRAELDAMRKQFQTAPQPQPAAPFAAAIPYESRRRTKQDFFANARMVVWTLGIVAALWVTFHAMQASSQHAAKEPDHILATVTGTDGDTASKADQNNDN